MSKNKKSQKSQLRSSADQEMREWEKELSKHLPSVIGPFIDQWDKYISQDELVILVDEIQTLCKVLNDAVDQTWTMDRIAWQDDVLLLHLSNEDGGVSRVRVVLQNSKELTRALNFAFGDQRLFVSLTSVIAFNFLARRATPGNMASFHWDHANGHTLKPLAIAQECGGEAA
jgi:hypothetical protein